MKMILQVEYFKCVKSGYYLFIYYYLFEQYIFWNMFGKSSESTLDLHMFGSFQELP